MSNRNAAPSILCFSEQTDTNPYDQPHERIVKTLFETSLPHIITSMEDSRLEKVTSGVNLCMEYEFDGNTNQMLSSKSQTCENASYDDDCLSLVCHAKLLFRSVEYAHGVNPMKVNYQGDV